MQSQLIGLAELDVEESHWTWLLYDSSENRLVLELARQVKREPGTGSSTATVGYMAFVDTSMVEMPWLFRNESIEFAATDDGSWITRFKAPNDNHYTVICAEVIWYSEAEAGAGDGR